CRTNWSRDSVSLNSSKREPWIAMGASPCLGGSRTRYAVAPAGEEAPGPSTTRVWSVAKALVSKGAGNDGTFRQGDEDGQRARRQGRDDALAERPQRAGRPRRRRGAALP